MYGKFFSSTYTGSMFGAGSDVFAVWGYVIAHTQKGQVELNPKLLAAIIGAPEERIAKAIEKLCSPDPRSRSKVEDGKRLIREGEYAYKVPTYYNYRRIRDEDDRREYNRRKKAEQRKRDKVKTSQDMSIRESNMSAQAEAEAEAEVKSVKGGNSVEHHNGKRPSPKFSQLDFDERDWRKMSEAKKKIAQRLSAAIGTGQSFTDAEYWAAVAEESGLTVKRVMKLQQSALTE